MNDIISMLGRGLSITLAGIGLSLATPLAAEQTGEEVRNVELIRKGFDAWRDGTGSPYELLDDRAVWTIAGQSQGAGTYADKEAFLREVIRPFNARMKSRLIPAVQRIYADGDTVVVRFDASGTASDGVVYTNSYAWFLELREGRIVRAQAFFDSLAFDELWRRVRPMGQR
jgi:ketosteroid isomerase-like protein